jgi:cell division protein FtsB
MRLILICLAALLLLIQYPLWLGKGGWLRVWDLDKQVTAAQKKNNELKARNAKLNSEVQDLKEGTGAVEERARYELGMIKENEIFIQVLESAGKPVAAQTPAPTPSPPAVKQH